jgi:hypothetical protein
MIRFAILSLAGLLVFAVNTGEARVLRRGCPSCRVAVVEVAPEVAEGCPGESAAGEAGCSGEAQEGPARRVLTRAPLRSLIKRGAERRQDRRANRRERRSSRRGCG